MEGRERESERALNHQKDGRDRRLRRWGRKCKEMEKGDINGRSMKERKVKGRKEKS